MDATSLESRLRAVRERIDRAQQARGCRIDRIEQGDGEDEPPSRGLDDARHRPEQVALDPRSGQLVELRKSRRPPAQVRLEEGDQGAIGRFDLRHVPLADQLDENLRRRRDADERPPVGRFLIAQFAPQCLELLVGYQLPDEVVAGAGESG